MCLSVLDAPLTQARFYILGETASRSGESLSPKRGFEARSEVGLTCSPSERCDSWVKCDLAQASVSRLSECSKLCLCVVLVQAR